MSDERRSLARWRPRRGEYVLFSIAGGRVFICSLEDLNAGGMRIACSGEAAAALNSKVPIFIDDCPRNLRNVLRRMRGEVIWAAGGRRGIRFSQEPCVTNREMRELLDEPEPLPWADWPGQA